MEGTKHIAESLLLESHPPNKASAIFSEKILHKPLRLRPSSPDPTSQNARSKRRTQRLRKEEKKSRRQKIKPLSAKEKRISGIYDIPDDAKRYEIYQPLHKLWLEYMWEIIGIKEGKTVLVDAQSIGSKLASADYHGAEVMVARSRSTGMVGLSGIVVRDTKFTFQIITMQNDLKTTPKRHTVFRFSIAPPDVCSENGKEESARDEDNPRTLIFELYGSQFEHRAPDRATKKFKSKNMTNL